MCLYVREIKRKKKKKQEGRERERSKTVAEPGPVSKMRLEGPPSSLHPALP